jgi:glycosyltransferase 2 family protein
MHGTAPVTRLTLSRSRLAACLATLAVLAVVCLTPQLLGSRIDDAVSALSGASPGWLWAAAALFAFALGTSAFAWRVAFGACGARLSRSDACARYAVGSLLNSVAPAKLGDALRIALFSRSLEGPDRLWTGGGVFAAIGAARALVVAVLVVAASATGALPLWPVFALCGVVLVLALLAYRFRNAHTKVAHLLDGLAALEQAPRLALLVLFWAALGAAARIAAAAAVAMALGVPHPLLAALVIVPVIDLANTIPLTPGNIGIASGAVTVALQSRGIGMTQALSTGIAFHAVETVAGLSVGGLGALWLSRETPAVRRWAPRVAMASACLVVAAGMGAMVFDVV